MEQRRAPEWLNQEFFQKSLTARHFNEYVDIKLLGIKPAIEEGNNYMSRLYRVQLAIINKDAAEYYLSVIVKSLPDGEYVKQIVSQCNFNIIEKEMLNNTLPSILRILKETEPFFPRCYFDQGPPRELMVLEDLCEDGYRLAERQKGYDEQHAMMILTQLAKQHAGSLTLIKENPNIIQTYNDYFWRFQNKEMFSKMALGGIEVLCKDMGNWDNFPKEKYIDKLNNLKKDFVKKTCNVYERDQNGLNVILHGDLWFNNVMFKYNGKTPTQVKFVDFQLATYNNPVLDIIYFLFSSVHHQVRSINLDKFLKHYHDEFMSTLKMLNYSLKYDLSDLKNDFQKRLFFGVSSTLTVFPIACYTSSSKIINIDELLDQNTDSMDSFHFKNPRYQNEIRELLPYFEKHNLI